MGKTEALIRMTAGQVVVSEGVQYRLFRGEVEVRVRSSWKRSRAWDTIPGSKEFSLVY